MKVLVTMCAVFTLTASLSESESLMTENLNHTDKSGGHQVNENVSRDYSLFPELFVEPYTLKNGLQSYLVHDSSVTDTTVSITVNSGSYADPDEVHGLAHFLEHLMLNTAIDIDSPTTLQEFVLDNFGHVQSTTTTQQTTFEFTVDSELLTNILPIFAQQFSQPDFSTMLASFDASFFDEDWQINQHNLHFILSRINAMTANPAHPQSRFQLGNEATITQFNHKELNQFLREFHQQHYVASNIKLAIVSSLPVNDIKNIVEDNFEQLSTKRQPLEKLLPPAFLAEHVRQHIHVNTEAGEKLLMLQFPLTNDELITAYHSHEYLEFLFSIQQRKALTTQLIERGLVRYMSPLIEPNAYTNDGSASFLFGLTKLGEQKSQEILAMFLQYVEVIKQHGLSEEHARAFSQYRKAQQQNYYYDSSYRLAHKLSTPPVTRLANDGIGSKFRALNKKSMHSLLAQLNLDNLRIWHINDGLKTSRQVDFAKSSFEVVPFQADYLKENLKGLPLLELPHVSAAPELDESLPTSYSIPNGKVNLSHPEATCDANSSQTKPEQVYASGSVLAWHATSAFAKEPQAFTGLRISSVHASQKENAALMLRLFSIVFAKALLPVRNSAQLRENLSMLTSQNNNDELFITLTGTNDVHTKYIEQVIATLIELDVSEQEFNAAIEEARFSLTNITNTATLAQSQYYVQSLVSNGASNVDIKESLMTLGDIKFDAFSRYIALFIKQFSVELFAFGTTDVKATQQLAASIEQHIRNQQREEIVLTEKSRSPIPNYCSFAKSHKQRQSNVSTSFLVEQPTASNIANHLVLKSLLQNSRLRREFANQQKNVQLIFLHQMLNGSSALTVSLLSTQLDTKEMKRIVTNWLSLAAKHIARLSQYEIERAKEAWLRRLTGTPNSFYKELAPLLADWLSDNASFETKAQVADALNYVSQRTLQQEFEYLLNSSHAKKIQITLKGQAS